MRLSRVCTAIALLVAVGFALPVVVGQPPGSGGPPGLGGGPPMPQPAKPQLKVKVFKLERGDPEAVVVSLNALLEEADAEVPAPTGGPPGVVGAIPGGFGSVPPVPGGAVGFGGGPAPPGGFGGIAPGGNIGCFLGTGGMTTPVWRATVQLRTKSVIVRGADRHIKVTADLVAMLDRPANAPLPKLEVVKAFSLKHADAAELVAVIDALSFDDVRLATPEEKVLAVIAPDETAKAIAELVKELDVPGEPEVVPEPKKGIRQGKLPSEFDRKPPQ